MRILRSERFAAFMLLGAAALGLVLANSPVGPAVLEVRSTHLAIPGIGVDLSVEHWISDGLLAIFFFVVAIELRHELAAGQLASPAKAIRPAIAALGGVLVPALVYLALTSASGQERGWPIPTATDIAFALGVLAVFGRGIPGRVRVFVLALAIIDDVVAILIIAVVFARSPDLLALGLGVVGVVVFGILSRFLGGPARVPVAIVMVLVGVATWVFVLGSGIHATIAGVALGLVMARKPAARARHALEPVSNAFVLPVFALSAALVPIPSLGLGDLAPAFWAIVIALPVGKLVGVGLGTWLGSFVGTRTRLDVHETFAIATLAGIGFTVSLLMNELAFADDGALADEGTLAVILGSAFALVVSGVVVATLGARHRRTLAG